MLAFMASFSVYAQEVTEIENETRIMTHEDLGTVTVKHSELVAPYRIEVNAPSGTIISISGPTNTNIQNWNVSNGRLIIWLNDEDLEVLYPREKPFNIEMGTSVGIATIYIIVEE